MTGPVGAPVGDPPLGSMLTARPAAALKTPNFSLLSGIIMVPCMGSSPREIGGRSLPGSIHSSQDLSAGIDGGCMAVTFNILSRDMRLSIQAGCWVFGSLIIATWVGSGGNPGCRNPF